MSAAVVLEFDEADYSADLGLAVGDALVEASPSVVACNSVTFSTSQSGGGSRLKRGRRRPSSSSTEAPTWTPWARSCPMRSQMVILRRL